MKDFRALFEYAPSLPSPAPHRIQFARVRCALMRTRAAGSVRTLPPLTRSPQYGCQEGERGQGEGEGEGDSLERPQALPLPGRRGEEIVPAALADGPSRCDGFGIACSWSGCVFPVQQSHSAALRWRNSIPRGLNFGGSDADLQVRSGSGSKSSNCTRRSTQKKAYVHPSWEEDPEGDEMCFVTGIAL